MEVERRRRKRRRDLIKFALQVLLDDAENVCVEIPRQVHRRLLARLHEFLCQKDNYHMTNILHLPLIIQKRKSIPGKPTASGGFDWSSTGNTNANELWRLVTGVREVNRRIKTERMSKQGLKGSEPDSNPMLSRGLFRRL